MLEILVSSQGFELDKEGFSRKLELQRHSSRQASSIEDGVFAGSFASSHKLKATKFVGEKTYSTKTKIAALFMDDQSIKKAKTGEEVKIVLASTPFYGESGGQVGDTGIIKNKSAKVEIYDTQKSEQTIIHLGQVTS